MASVEELYDAAARAGLLTRAVISGADVFVDYTAPDEDVLDGLGVSRNHASAIPQAGCRSWPSATRWKSAGTAIACARSSRWATAPRCAPRSPACRSSMPHSIRERILQALTTRLTPVATTEGAQLLRSPPTGVTREQCPALLLFPESDTIVQRANDRVERQLVVRLVALARETVGETPEAIADRLLVSAHAALFSDVNLGSLCLGLQEMGSEWEVEDADATAVAIPARYQIDYRTLVSDLSAKG